MPRQRHKVFVSYHHETDQEYKDRLVEEMSEDIVDGLKTEAIWQKIRDKHIADATVVLVLIGRHTWSRRFVDWEIGSALNKSKNNSRCGVLGVVLPDHPDYGRGRRNPNLLPQRLAANMEGDDPYVRLYDWPGEGSLSDIRDWVHTAFLRRHGPVPDNHSKRFKNNKDTSTRASDEMTVADGLLLAGAVIVGVWAVDRFVLSPMRARYGSSTYAQSRLRHVFPNRHPGLRCWGREHGSI